MGVLAVDDQDPAIEYTGTWAKAGGPDEYRRTTTWTTSAGATAKVTFSGTGVAVYGTITTLGLYQTPISTYTIDNDVTTTTRFAGKQINGTQYGIAFYTIANLQPGRHTLLVMNESPQGQLFLDYFLIDGIDTAGGSPTISSQAAASTSQQSAQRKSNRPPVEPILGGTLGGLALICFLVLFLFAIKGRRKREPSSPTPIAHGGPHNSTGVSEISPFIPPPSAHQTTPSLHSQSHTMTSVEFPRPNVPSFDPSSQTASASHTHAPSSSFTQHSISTTPNYATSASPPSRNSVTKLPPRDLRAPQQFADPPPYYQR